MLYLLLTMELVFVSLISWHYISIIDIFVTYWSFAKIIFFRFLRKKLYKAQHATTILIFSTSDCVHMLNIWASIPKTVLRALHSGLLKFFTKWKRNNIVGARYRIGSCQLACYKTFVDTCLTPNFSIWYATISTWMYINK